ncbi:MAG TPA: hypothetical protein VJR05_14015 [Acidimicrobiia bacterium]|nr:hypothetical protein [Acidimicrobiia bacterium]
MAHSGLLATDGDERPIRAELDFAGDDLVISIASGPLGAWPLSLCRIEPRDDRFLVEVDGDLAWFRPDDPAAFARETLTHQRAGGLASAVQAARLAATVDPVPSPPEAPVAPPLSPKVLWAGLGPRQRNLALIGGGLVIGLLVMAMLIDRPPSPAVVNPTPLVTTAPPPQASALTLAQLSMRWNEVAADLRIDMFILGVPEGRRMEVELGPGILLYATEDEGRVRTLMIGAGPGEGEHGQAVLAAWGTLISLVNPELTPEERRGLLDRLGVDVERPLQLGLHTTAEQNGVSYWLQSGVLNGRVLFGAEVAP